MLTSGISEGLKALWIFRENHNYKKLQFETSSIVMYKRIIPVILSVISAYQKRR